MVVQGLLQVAGILRFQCLEDGAVFLGLILKALLPAFVRVMHAGNFDMSIQPFINVKHLPVAPPAQSDTDETPGFSARASGARGPWKQVVPLPRQAHGAA